MFLFQTKICQVHDAVTRGSLAETQKIISEEPKKKLAIAKDSCGIPLIHKAVYYDHPDIVAWLVENYPITPQQKDRVRGQTSLPFSILEIVRRETRTCTTRNPKRKRKRFDTGSGF